VFDAFNLSVVCTGCINETGLFKVVVVIIKHGNKAYLLQIKHPQLHHRVMHMIVLKADNRCLIPYLGCKKVGCFVNDMQIPTKNNLINN